MATSEVDICNSALAKLGVEPITSFLDNTKRGRLCALQYPKIRTKILRMHPWNFAAKQVQLTPLVTPPLFEYSYQYNLPADFIRTVDAYRPGTRYTIEGKFILSNDGVMDFTYIYDVKDVNLFDTLFSELLALGMAVELCYPLVQSRELYTSLLQVFMEEIRLVRTVNAQDTIPKSMEPDYLINSRRTWFDPTRGGIPY